MALTRPLTSLASQKLLSSLTPFILQEESLTCHFTHIKNIQLSFHMSWEGFSLTISTIQLNLGNVQVNVNGLFTKQWIWKPNFSNSYLFSLASHLGNLAKRANATTFFPTVKWPSKHLIWKNNIPWNYVM